MQGRESHHISLWPLFAAIATIAGLVWWFDRGKQRTRAVTGPGTVRDSVWSDKTIELIETAEEAVVSKRARVAEEVVISKTGSDRVETVREIVRRQQIEVERIPASEGRPSPN